jgi:hypothetical protein
VVFLNTIASDFVRANALVAPAITVTKIIIIITWHFMLHPVLYCVAIIPIVIADNIVI